MFAFYRYKLDRLPNSITDWNQQNVKKTIPNLWQFRIHYILKTVNDEIIRRPDLTND